VIEIAISAAYDDLENGESIAINGACLTVIGFGSGQFRVEAVATTQERTRFGDLKPGDRVNLERSLKAGDRLGGHFVQGHVDGVAQVTATSEAKGGRILDLRVPAEIGRTAVLHGSITVEGVSLTVNALPKPGTIQISLIPYTLDHTTLGGLKVGDRVHVEGDMLAKFTKSLIDGERRSRTRKGGKRKRK